MSKKVLVIGSGGREHAIVWKLSQSNVVEDIFVAPGSWAIQQVVKTKNVNLNIKDFKVSCVSFDFKKIVDEEQNVSCIFTRFLKIVDFFNIIYLILQVIFLYKQVYPMKNTTFKLHYQKTILK